MRNLGHCTSAVLASALRNPDSSQYQDFKSTLKCVSALVHFALMAQYRSHIPDTHSYMESYLQTFHQTKDIFLEFRTSKATRAQANHQDRELRELMADQRAKAVCHRTVANRRQLADQEMVERSDRQADLIRREKHFNFIKVHYLTQLASHVRRFGSKSMYSTEIGDLAHKDQIKDGYRRSNKNEAARQILSHYGRQHALGIRLQTIKALSKVEGVIVVEDSGMEILTVPSCSTPRWVLKGRRMKNTSTLTELCTALDIHYSNMMEEILCFIRQTATDDLRLRADPAELGLLSVEGFAQLEIPVPNFQETDRFQIHRARCTGTKAFCNSGSRNDWVWVQTGGEANYGDLRGRVARLLALFKIRNIPCEAAAVHCLAVVGILDPINGGRFHIPSRHIRVGNRINRQDMRIVSIEAVIGQAQVIPSGEKQWIVNHRIDLKTFNEIY